MSDNKPYIVSARKYRPSTFKTVVGQRALTSTLKNAIDSNRLAQAYLFCGPRGVGKTSCARIFAKTINCENRTEDGEACGVCASCRGIEMGNSFNIVELDAASNNSVDDIRAITEQVYVPAQEGKYRVFIIDEVHMLSNAAFNAFLKTLEEPPANVVFILATTEKHKVIPTILSRCQIYDFKRITIGDMVEHLEYVATNEGIETDREALGVIAQKADGAMRDALSVFDQVAASTRGKVTYANTIESLNVLDYDYYFRMVDSFREGDVSGVLLIYKDIRDKGFDSLFMVNGLAAHVRDLMVAADPRTVGLLETSEETGRKYISQAGTLPAQWYYAALRLLNDCDVKYRTSSNKRLLVELTLIRLCQLMKPASPPFDDPDRIWPLGDPCSGVKAADKSPVASKDTVAANKTLPEATTPVSHEEHRRPIRSDRPHSFRLNEKSQGAKVAVHNLSPRNERFGYDDFMRVWEDFAATHPSLHILVNAMRGATPVKTTETEYSVVVDHQAQVQAFEISMQQLVGFLRDGLRNDLLTLKVEINSHPVANKQMPPKEFLRKVVENNSAMAQFLKDLDAELV